jgi:hypothetical protein
MSDNRHGQDDRRRPQPEQLPAHGRPDHPLGKDRGFERDRPDKEQKPETKPVDPAEPHPEQPIAEPQPAVEPTEDVSKAPPPAPVA